MGIRLKVGLFGPVSNDGELAMFRNCWFAVCVVMLAVVALAMPTQASLYTFENLTAGADLIGQDNWVYANNPTNPGANATSHKVLFGAGFNTSKVSSPFTGDATVARQNDANFSIPTFTGTEKVYYQADLQYGTQQNNIMILNITPSPVAFNALAPWIGFAPTGSGPTFAMNFNFRAFGAGAPAQLFIPVGVVAPQIQTGDWVTIRMELDLPANGGNGNASAFYKDLTLGEMSFTPIPGIQNQSGNLMAFPAGPRYIWEWMYMRGGISNGNNCFDNFEVGIIPEPSSMFLALIGLISLVSCRARNR